MANVPENVNRAMSLLREAAAVLAQNSAPSNETGRSESGTPTTTSSNVAISTSSSFSTPNTRPSSSGSHPSTSDALRNFRTLFAPYGNTNRDTPHRPPPKKVCRRKGVTKQKETWTHEVFCLGSVDEQATPTRERKDILQRAGLGRSKIKFDANTNAIDFKEKLEEVFPKLILGRGFELLRRGPSGNGLVLIRQPASGYSVKYLRESSGIGQALLYIRPLQMNLDMSPEDLDDTEFDSEVRQSVMKQGGG